MRKINVSLIVLFVLSSMFSCIDNKYHWDNLNKEGLLNPPPIPLGSFEKIMIKDLNGNVIGIPGLPQITQEFQYTFDDLFGSSSIKNFFHKYVNHDISIEGLLEVDILGEDSGLEIAISFAALNEAYEVIEDVYIEGPLEEIKYGTQKLKITIPQKYISKMKDEGAKHLQMTIILTTPKNIELEEGDFIQLSKMIIKTAGYLVDL